MTIRPWARAGAARLGAGLAGVALAAALSTPAALAADARDSAWSACDGYGKPSKSGDGMTKYALTMVIFNSPDAGDTGRRQQGRGSAAVDLCTHAVAFTPEAHWRRRVSLLQARGLHRMETSDMTGVLEDFDMARTFGAAGADDALYQRSQGVGLDIARAYALRRLDRIAEGRALALRTLDERPYARSPLSATLMALGPKAEDGDYAKVSRALARLDPPLRGPLFLDAAEQGDFATAIALYPYLSPPRKSDTWGLDPLDKAIEEIRSWAAGETYKTEAAGHYAYALAASGRSAEARAALAEAKTRVETARPPSPVDPKPRFDNARAAAVKARDNTLRDSQASLALWTDLVERRIQVTEGKAEAVADGLKTAPLPRNAGGADLLSALTAALPGDNQPAVKAVADLRTQLRARLRSGGQDDPAALSALLPQAETRDRLEAWRETKPTLLASVYGYYHVAETDGRVRVHVRGVKAPGPVIEEMALLRAAQLALESGHHGFVLVDRSDVNWTINGYYMGSLASESPGGFESEIVVRFVDPKTTTAPPWLVLDADALRAALEPLYVKTSVAAVASKAGAP